MKAFDKEHVIRRLEQFLSCDQPNSTYFRGDVEGAISLLRELQQHDDVAVERKVAKEA